MGQAGPRFSYSNVMATLAVFLALGGSAYAVSKINGSRLKDHSVAGRKIKAATLTGRQIREATLGKVPRARRAGTAHRAIRAARAGTAHSAGNAQTAATANNSLALGGLTPAAFERSTRVLYGSGRIDAENPQPIFSSPLAHFDLETDGDADRLTQLRVKNDNNSAALDGTVFTASGPPAAFGVAAGAADQIGPVAGTGTDYLDTVVSESGDAGASVWVHCLFNPSAGTLRAFCWGLQASA